MFIGEYDYDLDMQVKAEEAFEQGAHENAVKNAQNLYANGVSIDIIAKSLNMTTTQISEIIESTH